MPANASEWDARHFKAAAKTAEEPASIVLEWLPMLPGGPALDLACGRGRHTLLLAGQGRAVTAVDWSTAALEILEQRARAAKLLIAPALAANEIGAHEKGIHPTRANLQHVQLADAAFAVIVCVRYLERSLFPQMEQALRAGGVLLFETFTGAQLHYSGGPRNPDYLLEPGELRRAFPRLDVLFYRELNAGQGIASLVARKRAGTTVNGRVAKEGRG